MRMHVHVHHDRMAQNRKGADAAAATTTYCPSTMPCDTPIRAVSLYWNPPCSTSMRCPVIPKMPVSIIASTAALLFWLPLCTSMHRDPSWLAMIHPAVMRVILEQSRQRPECHLCRVVPDVVDHDADVGSHHVDVRAPGRILTSADKHRLADTVPTTASSFLQ